MPWGMKLEWSMRASRASWRRATLTSEQGKRDSGIPYLLAPGMAYCRHGRRHHPGQYGELGEPHLFLNNSPSLSRRTASFIVGEDYSRIGDPAFTAIGDRTRWFYRASEWLFVSSLIALFTFWFSL